MAVAPNLGAGTVLNAPMNDPMGVRTAETMNTSCMESFFFADAKVRFHQAREEVFGS
jgi:hypothetical protein